MASMRPTNCTSYSNESINEVCSSTASLSVSPSNPFREYSCTSKNDAPTVVSYSSSTAHSDQFDDAPEEYAPSPQALNPPAQKQKHTQKSTASINPLHALAMACAAEKVHEHKETPSSSIATEGSQNLSFNISQNDVLCGRGGLTNHHPGNVFFRRLVRIKQESYLRASKREKAGVAREIVDVIRKLDPSGRFLKKDTQNPGHWIEIGDRKAREKTSQALREGAPELREELNTEKSLVTGDSAQKEATFVNDGARAILDSMRHHQAQTWQQMAAGVPDVPEKPPSANSNRIRIVSTDSHLSGRHPAGAHSTMLPFRKVPFSSLHTHVILDDQRPAYLTTRQLPSASSYRHPQPDDMDETESFRCSTVGSKRKSIDLASNDISSINSVQSGSVQSDSSSSKRGPRLKLLKQRLQSADY